MGNSLNTNDINKIVGMTLVEARIFIKTHKIHQPTDLKRIIKEIRPVSINGEGIFTNDLYISDRCNVEINNGIITKIISFG